MFSYFYSQSFYKKFNKYPFWEYSHWLEWIFERIYEEIEINKICNIIEIHFWSLNYIKKNENLVLKTLNTKESIEWYKKIKKILDNPILNF